MRVAPFIFYQESKEPPYTERLYGYNLEQLITSCLLRCTLQLRQQS